MNIKYEIVKDIDYRTIDEIIKLISKVFDSFVASDYTQQGKERFYSFIEKNNLVKKINFKEIILIAKVENKIIGIFSTTGKNHISLFFVDKEYQNKGIAKKIFNIYLKELGKEGEKLITVNSSLYAEKIYKKLGFFKIDHETEEEGIRYIPMAYELEKI